MQSDLRIAEDRKSADPTMGKIRKLFQLSLLKDDLCWIRDEQLQVGRRLRPNGRACCIGLDELAQLSHSAEQATASCTSCGYFMLDIYKAV